MALTALLEVNGEAIGWVVVRRTARGKGPDGLPLADEVHTYEVRVAMDRGADAHTTVRHRYGDGALALMAKAMLAAAQAGG